MFNMDGTSSLGLISLLVALSGDIVLYRRQRKESPIRQHHITPIIKIIIMKINSRSVRRGAAEASDAVPNTSVHTLGHPLEGQAAVHVLNGAGDGGLDALDATLDARGEEADVALPAGRPLGGLVGHALLGSGHDHVEGREDADAGGAHAEDLGALGDGELGDAMRHG